MLKANLMTISKITLQFISVLKGTKCITFKFIVPTKHSTKENWKFCDSRLLILIKNYAIDSEYFYCDAII